MRKILAAITAVTATAVAASAPLAQAPDERLQPATLRLPVPTAPTSEAEVPPFAVLPNTKVLTRKLMRSNRSVAARQLTLSQHVVAFFESPAHEWMRAPRHEKCWEVPWQRSCVVARHAYRLHLTLAVAAQQKLWRELPNTDNWTRAMRLTQRVFPGTYGWLERISTRECRACYTVPGAFICNYQGSGACGPMQFMSGTFYGHADDAKAAVARRGFIVDPSVWSWQNPLGQALTAGYMRWAGIDGCHWCS